MGLFVRRDRLWEERIADLKEAHEKRVHELKLLVDSLAEQIEFLRATQGQHHPALRSPALNPSNLPELEFGAKPYLSEEEEDLRTLHNAGRIDAADLEAALVDLGVGVGPIEID